MRFLTGLFLGLLLFPALHGQERTVQNPSTSLEEALAEDVKAFLEKHRGTALSDLNTEDLTELASALSISRQEESFLREIRAESFILGGLGHYKLGENALGAFFTGLDVAIIAGTIAGTYALLPESLKQGGGGLDYFGNSAGVVREAWEASSFLDILPSLAVLLAGSGLRILFVSLVADNAEELGREKIRSGKLRFTAKPYLELGRMFSLGLGISLTGQY